MKAAAHDHFCAEFDQQQQYRSKSAPWLEPLRFQALAEFASLGFPGRGAETWKYTRVERFLKPPFKPSGQAPGRLTASQIEPLAAGHPGPRLVFENGYLRPDLSAFSALPKGVILRTLADAIAGGEPLVKEALHQSSGALTPAFQALNRAMLQDGLFLELAPDTQLGESILVIFYQQPEADVPLAAYPSVLVVAGPRSKATLVEMHCGEPGAVAFASASTTLLLGELASLNYCKLQDEAPRNVHVGQLRISQQAGSRCQVDLAMLGGTLARQEVAAELRGAGAGFVLHGAVHGWRDQHHDCYALIEHQAPDCLSETHWKSVLEDQARGVFCGHIRVQSGADGADAKLATASLLLSDQAEMDAKPVLEIYADDVKCTHGATIGQLREEQVFYLLSRGIGEHQARALLMQAFTGAITGRMADETLRRRTEELFARRYQTTLDRPGG